MDLRQSYWEEDDLPQAVLPDQLKNAVPDFQSHGARHCGGHWYRPDSFDPDLLQIPVHFSAHTWLCHGCEVRDDRRALHVLRCGHVLCRDCLLRAADAACVAVAHNRADLDALLEASDLLDREAHAVSVPEIRQAMADETHSKRLEALDLAELTCCGVLSGLWDYLPCMDPGPGREFWLVLHYVLTRVQDRLYCAWPDCGDFVPRMCLFAIPGPESRWHCVSCGGNSQPAGSGRDYSCPAR